MNGRTVALAPLQWMKSVEHYVEFHSGGPPVIERVPLRDMVSQSQGMDGMQPHRSYWVARHAVQQMTRRDGSAVLLLTDGTEIPVSRHRKAQIAAWLSDA